MEGIAPLFVRSYGGQAGCPLPSLSNMRILVAMSGGVDSSVTAHLLRRLGHDLVGVQMELWTDPLAPALAQVLPSKCCSAETRARARRVADDLGIPFHRIDLSSQFKREVVDPFLEDHRRMRTPNPCIACNRRIKFGALLDLARELSCEKIATGHYARIAKELLPSGGRRLLLLEALDERKDQSYFLYALTQAQLRKVLFPLGTLRKAEVFALAKSFGVPLPTHYRESQDLCFFPERGPHAFLDRYLQDVIAPGPIVDLEGNTVGAHRGLPHYTTGQRRGLRIGGRTIPLEVVGKDPGNNSLVVAPQGTLRIATVHFERPSWINWRPSSTECISLQARTRSLGPLLPGKLRGRTFRFASPEPPVSPGQSIVFYRGQEVVGGGVISAVA